ncbi:MAG: hypothetical protein AAB733_04705, partial [Patescibacteria group bacterium]
MKTVFLVAGMTTPSHEASLPKPAPVQEEPISDVAFQEIAARAREELERGGITSEQREAYSP